MAGFNLPDDWNQAAFDRYFGQDDREPEIVATCICCEDELTDEQVVLIHGKVFCIDCSEHVVDEVEVA